MWGMPGVEDLGTTLAIEHADSASEHALQVADAVAWCLLQKHEHQDERLWQVVKGFIRGWITAAPSS